MHFEFQRAYRVGNAFDVVAQAMSKIVHGIDAPLIARPMMKSMPNPVKNRISQPDVRRLHIDFRPQSPSSIRERA